MADYPEHEKLLHHAGDIVLLDDFLNWLHQDLMHPARRLLIEEYLAVDILRLRSEAEQLAIDQQYNEGRRP